MRVVLDTNILIRANPKARGPARELLEQIAFGEHVLVISHYLLLEIERVLAYPRVSTRWKLTAQEVEEYLQTLAAISQMVTPLSGGPIILKDVDDDPVIYTAVAGRAEVLCTRDAHFYEAPVLVFCRQNGIEIMDDVQLLSVIRNLER